MRNSLLIFILVFFTTHIFSQDSVQVVNDSNYTKDWEITEYYSSEIDLVENTNDTLLSNILHINYYFTDHNYHRIGHRLVFYELDNLLMIEETETMKQKFYFLIFRVEVGVDNFITKWYRTEEGNFDIQLRYYKFPNGVKKLLAVEISEPGFNSTSYTYYIENE